MENENILIALIGDTGAGKTTFISRLTGRTDLEIGHGIDSCTQKIQKISYQHKGQTVTLIDTPGFDDSDDIQRSDADILNDIATFLQKSYDAGQLLTGVIWLQSIATIRSGGSERRRARLFKKILGENAYKRVVIATTMWSKICDDDHGMKQMEQRQSQVWHDMIDQDALVTRHDDNKASADKIIEHLLSTSKSKPLEPLQIQTELARDGKLCNTSAGQQLDNDLGDMIKKLSKDLDNLRRERDASKAEIEELQVQINRVENERFSLRRYAVKKFNHVVKSPVVSFLYELAEIVDNI